MIVYRVENEDQLGPYSAEWKKRRKLQLAHNDDAHPGPARDGEELAEAYYAPEHYGLRYAFASLEGLHEWFEGWLEEILKAGFKIVERVVPDEHVIHGNHQVAYYEDRVIA
jgi:hypothetical protein